MPTPPEALRRIQECIDRQEESLDLSRLRLTKIPVALTAFSHIKSLYLYNNQISRIENLETLTSLTKLSLSENQIRRVENLDTLTGLTSLDISSNQISRIENLDTLTDLNTLDMYKNKITRIENLDVLKSLTELDLSYNQIHDLIGLESDLLRRLKVISLQGNPLKDIPIHDLSNKVALLDYVKQSEANQLRSNYFLKVNIIGEGRIGKTQLLNFFNGKPYVSCERETHGTNTRTYVIPNTDYTATIWDFGGQSYHHGFHQVFLGRTDFNIVLWRNKPDQRPDYGYWLGTARAYTGGKENDRYLYPLVLLQNVWSTTDYDTESHVPDRVYYPDSEVMTRYQLTLDDVFVIDVKALHKKDEAWVSRHRYVWEQLHKRMIAHAQRLQVPGKWLAVKKRMDSEPGDVGIGFTKTQFAEKYKPQIQDSLEGVLAYLSFTGNILYFSEHERLSKYVFPNPPKLSDWLFKDALGETFAISNKGEISIAELKMKLETDEKVSIFLDLMLNFELIFEKPHQTDSSDTCYIIPQFLPENNDSFKQVLLQLLPFTFSLQFPDFFHDGKVFQFIANFGRFAIDETAYWKYGLLYSHPVTVGQQKIALQVLVYYLNDTRQLMVHVEDKKGKSEVAQEVYDYFVHGQKPALLDLSGTLPETPDFADSELELDKIYRRTRTEPKNIVWLSTQKPHYIDVAEGMKNVAARQYVGTCVNTQQRIKLDYMAINLLSTDTNRKVRVFFSYSHKDEPFRDELDNHFAMLKRSGRIETWHDRKTVAGQQWDAEIKRQLQEADLVLLMLSSDFLSSDYIWEHELSIVRERIVNNDGLVVVPIFTRPCDTAEFDMMVYQGAQKDQQSRMPWIASSPNRDEVYAAITTEIRTKINGFR